MSVLAGSKSGCYDILQFVHSPPEFLISGVKQGYYQINWDNSGYPASVTCGPVLQGEHIGLIFLQCWENPSFHSLSYRHGASAEQTLVQAWARVARSLKPLFSCCRNLLMACSICSWSGLASMFSSLCWSGADCAGDGSGMSHRESQKPESNILFGISQVLIKFVTSKHLNWDVSI